MFLGSRVFKSYQLPYQQQLPYPQQLPYQQQLPREQVIPATQQIMPTYVVPAANMPPTMMPDNSTMLRTAPYMPYMANPPAVQQYPIQQPANLQAGAKQSKAIKIVNPETMKEVDISNFTTTSPSSSSHSTPKPTAESGLQSVDAAMESKDKEVCYITRHMKVVAAYLRMYVCNYLQNTTLYQLGPNFIC